MKKTISLFLAAAMAFTLFGCSQGSRRFTATVTDAFDTVTTVIAYDSSQQAFDAHMKQFEDALTRYDRLFDIYHEYEGINNLCTLNRKAKDAPVEADGAIIELLLEGKKAYAESDGRLNICLGAVLSLWHAARETALEHPKNAYLPSPSALQEASRHTDPEDLIINEQNRTVYFADSELQLDVGAVAKGYSAQRLADGLKADGVWQDFMLNLGGNVITNGFKNSDGKTKWNIQIENPRLDSEEALDTLTLTDLSVVTSGDYQRYFTYDGKNYCHIIDPNTLMPAEYFSGVTVICGDSALADRLSTLLFVTPLDEGQKMIEALDGAEAVWVDKDYHVTYSSGFAQYRMQ